jgi:hypothetical protein
MSGQDPFNRGLVLTYMIGVSLGFAMTAFVPVMLLLDWLIDSAR